MTGFYPTPGDGFYPGDRLEQADSLLVGHPEDWSIYYALWEAGDGDTRALTTGDSVVISSSIGPLDLRPSGVAIAGGTWRLRARGSGTLRVFSSVDPGGSWDWYDDPESYTWTPRPAVQVDSEDFVDVPIVADPDTLTLDAGDYPLLRFTVEGDIEVDYVTLTAFGPDGEYVQTGNGRWSDWFPEYTIVDDSTGYMDSTFVRITGDYLPDENYGTLTDPPLGDINDTIEAAYTGSMYGRTDYDVTYGATVGSRHSEPNWFFSDYVPDGGILQPEQDAYASYTFQPKLFGTHLRSRRGAPWLTPEMYDDVQSKDMVEGVHYDIAPGEETPVSYETAPRVIAWKTDTGDQLKVEVSQVNGSDNGDPLHQSQLVEVEFFPDWEVGDPLPEPGGAIVASASFAGSTETDELAFDLPYDSGLLMVYRHSPFGYQEAIVSSALSSTTLIPRGRYWIPEWEPYSPEQTVDGILHVDTQDHAHFVLGTLAADPPYRLRLETATGSHREARAGDDLTQASHRVWVTDYAGDRHAVWMMPMTSEETA